MLIEDRARTRFRRIKTVGLILALLGLALMVAGVVLVIYISSQPYENTYRLLGWVLLILALAITSVIASKAIAHALKLENITIKNLNVGKKYRYLMIYLLILNVYLAAVLFASSAVFFHNLAILKGPPVPVSTMIAPLDGVLNYSFLVYVVSMFPYMFYDAYLRGKIRK